MYVRSLAFVAACALGLAACGGDPAAQAGDSSGVDRSDPKTKQAELAFARCMREHGIDFPDPGSDDGPTLLRSKPGSAERDELEAAEKACERYRKDIKPPELSEEQQQKFKEAALAHARCMRDHGIDFPDPTFSEDGRATIKIGRGAVDPDDPDFKAAEKECQKIMEEVRP